MRSQSVLALAALSALNVLAGGCGAAPRFDHAVTDAHFCAPPRAWRSSDEAAAMAAGVVTDPASAASSGDYTKGSLEIARAIGALPLLARLEELQAAHASDADVLAIREQLDDEIAMAELDIESAGAELDCEMARSEHVGAALRDADANQERDLTVASLLVSAATAVASGVLTAKDASARTNGAVGIAGGVAGGAFGFGALAVHHTTSFVHPRNLLREVWLGPEHTDLVPSAVWTYLTKAVFGTKGEKPIRDALVLLWRQSGRLGDDPERPSAALIELYFGEGGEYDADELERRAAMLSEVLSSIQLMHQELRELAAEIWRR